MNATERFLRYAAIPTRSDPDSTATPSTDCQFSLARLLADELTALGLTNVRVTGQLLRLRRAACYAGAGGAALSGTDRPHGHCARLSRRGGQAPAAPEL